MIFLKKEILRTATTKPSRIVFVLVAAAAVVSSGYIIALAVLAPEQLAEATTAATDLICDKCVGTTDIADGAVTSGKIGTGQVKNSDLGTSAVTTTKISDTDGVQSADIVDGQVESADIADNAVTSAKIGADQVTSSDIGPGQVTGLDISDARGVSSSDIVDGQVSSSDIADITIVSSDIADSAITSSKLAGGAVKPNVHRVVGSLTTIASGTSGTATVDCPPGEILTGGGFGAVLGMRVISSHPLDENTWRAFVVNENPTTASFRAYALCIGVFP